MRAIFAGLTLLITSLTAGAQGDPYSINSRESKLEIHVSKEGAFKAFGHDHLIEAKQVSGQVQFDSQKVDQSSLRLTLPAKSLTVIDSGESEKDRRDVQSTMEGEKVLDVRKYSEIDFTSTGVSDTKKAADGWELTLRGKLKLHGVEKPVSFPLHVHVGNGELRSQGEVSILQTDYGITPIKVGGGAVKVKDRLKITFNILARKKQ